MPRPAKTRASNSPTNERSTDSHRLTARSSPIRQWHDHEARKNLGFHQRRQQTTIRLTACSTATSGDAGLPATLDKSRTFATLADRRPSDECPTCQLLTDHDPMLPLLPLPANPPRRLAMRNFQHPSTNLGPPPAPPPDGPLTPTTSMPTPAPFANAMTTKDELRASSNLAN